MANVTVKTSDGKIYTNPEDVHIPRNEKTKEFYELVDSYKPEQNEQADKTS